MFSSAGITHVWPLSLPSSALFPPLQPSMPFKSQSRDPRLLSEILKTGMGEGKDSQDAREEIQGLQSPQP